MNVGSIIAVASVADPNVVRDKALEIVSRPEYKLEAYDRLDFGFLWDALEWVMRPIVRLFRFLEGVSPEFAWALTIVCVIVLILLIAHIVYSIAQAVRPTSRLAKYAIQQERTLTPDQLEQMAEQAASEQAYLDAIRYLFQACVRRVELIKKSSQRAVTNRQYLRYFRDTPVSDSMRLMIQIIDTRWYGGHPCVAEDVSDCREAYNEIRGYLRRYESRVEVA